MSSSAQTLIVLAAIIGSYVWVSTPQLAYFSLQLAAAMVLLYFLVKKLTHAKHWQIAPRSMSMEIAILTIAVLLLIGTTGNLNSPYFPVAYVHLFFVVLALAPFGAITVTGALVLFHLVVTPPGMPINWAELAALPTLLILFLFTKHQFEEAVRERHSLQEKEAQINYYQQFIEQQRKELNDLAIEKHFEQKTWKNLDEFVVDFLKPKIEMVKELSHQSTSRLVIESQLTMISYRLETVMNQMGKNARGKEISKVLQEPLSDQRPQG